MFYLCIISRSFLHHSAATLAWAPVGRICLDASIVLSCVFRCRHRTQFPRSVAVLSSRAMDPASFWWALCHVSDYKEELSFALRNVALVLEVIGCARTVGNGDARPMEKTASGCSTSRLRWRRCAFVSHNPTNTLEHFSFHRGCVMDHSESSSLAGLIQKRASTHHYCLC